MQEKDKITQESEAQSTQPTGENPKTEREQPTENAAAEDVAVDAVATESGADGESAVEIAAEKNAATESGAESEKPTEKGEAEKNAAAPAATPKKTPKQVVKYLFKRWFIDAFTGMAQGLFVTLIAGTIICQIGDWCGAGRNSFGDFLKTLGNLAKMLMGAGIGVGMAHKLGCKPLLIFASAVSGLIGAWSMQLVNLWTTGATFSIAMGMCGNPIGAYIVALFGIEVVGLYAGKTKVDIVLVPLGVILLSLASVWAAWPFIKLVELLGTGIALAIQAGTAVKIIVGIFVAVVLGLLLTLPTSSAAIWIAIAATAIGAAEDYQIAMSIAGGAAVAGCAAHMVGFAVASFRENKWGGLVSQGIGTSMLQIPNLMRNPRILIPEIAASAVAGLVAVLLDMRCNAAGGGMGTSGLVGVFGVIAESQKWGVPTWRYVPGIVLCMFVIPAVVAFVVSELLRKVGWIKEGDQKI